jgi:hypothetical protein
VASVVTLTAAILAVEAPRSGSADRRTAGIGLIQLGNMLSATWKPARYPLVVVSPGDAKAAASLPGRSLYYTSGVSVSKGWSDGVPWTQADENGWLLTNADGQPLINVHYPGSDIGDVGSSAYQQAWIRNVLRFLGDHRGLDGVVIDDVAQDISPIAGAFPAKYPTQADWQQAMISFMAAVGPALRDHGYYVAANASSWIPGVSGGPEGNLAWFRELAPYVSGLVEENYAQTPDGTALRASGPEWNQKWDADESLITTVQSLGVDFLGAMYGSRSDTRAMSYGKASFLLAWNGGGGAFLYLTGNYADPWNPAWTTNVGRPASARQRVGVGWMRRYTDGMALVNPSVSKAQLFRLPGRYLEPTGASVRSVTLAPTSGLVLRSPKHA